MNIIEKIGFWIQGISDDTLSKMIKEFQNQPNEVEIYSRL